MLCWRRVGCRSNGVYFEGVVVVNNTFLQYFLGADPVVKTVMAGLIIVSLFSWTLIFQRGFFLRRTKQRAARFEDKFWSGTSLSALFTNLNAHKGNFSALESIFHGGFKEFARLRQLGVKPDAIMEGALRAMHIAKNRELSKLEDHLPMLATIGSVSPYIGLFGTVWGIMTAFQSLGTVQQATISMVAPGISEALVATAMGLFAAIPAVIFYNRYCARVEKMINLYDTFQDELISILYRQVHSTVGTAAVAD